ncbi:Glutamyl-tRNA reductase [hydrothermal vent metagenome]|uniref:glutamyl-tRNA reductase n=1 Tax=hydrothermal vent metagenome TaxID=652676 RepID=A0A1W1BF02_9ZZZZ
MSYQVVSFNHKNCEQIAREKLAFSTDDEKKEMLFKLTGFDFIEEAYIVSTCNRVEIVVATKDFFSSYHAILGLLSLRSGLSFHELKGMDGRYDDSKAILHIFSVVSSLESIVIGESQITGQVKDAYRFSFQNKTAGRRLNRVISYAIKCAAEVRNVTNISKHPISIPSVAVTQAHKIYGDNISGMTAVIIGAGEMGLIAAKNLLRLDCDVLLLGRDREKVERIAKELDDNVRSDTMENLHKYINRYRLLFSATSAKEIIIQPSMVESDNLDRVWFDMAIPRDIDEMRLEKLQLFRIDDLKAISKENYALKEEQATRAVDIVENYKAEFYKWLRALSIEPVIKDMRLQVKDAIDKELNRAIDKKFVPKEYRDNMQKMAEQMFNRFLHDATQNLRQCSSESSSTKRVDAIKNIFEITVDDKNIKKYKNEHHVKGYEK